MPVFELQAGDKIFEVEAADQKSAMAALTDKTLKDLSDITSNALKPKISQGRAAFEGFLSGASGNFRDEISGAAGASGLPEILGGFRAPVGAAKLAYEGMTQPGEATAAYEQRRNEARSIQKAGEEQYPLTTIAGQIGGAVALPVGRLLQAATLPARMARGAAVGAVYGAVAGAGAGEDLGSRATQAATGAALGGVVGAAAPPVVEGVIQAVRGVAAPAARVLRGAVNPEAEASRRTLGAIQRDVEADPGAAARLTPQEFVASAQGGGPATIMDLGGETTRALARSAANTSPEGRAALSRTVNDRFEGQSDRVTGWLANTFNYPNASAQQQALEQTARGVNRAAYARAYRDGADGLWSPELERLAGSDAVSSAMQSAARKAGDEAIVSGYGAMNPRITFTPDGRMQFNRGPNGTPTYPDLQYWDLVRREISDAAQNAGRGTSEARRLNSFATSLNSELDRLVPSYQRARQGAASFFGAENALEAGQNFVRQNFQNSEVRRQMARMSPTERQLFQDGFVSRYIDELNATGDRRNILNKIAEAPQAREKLNMVLGPNRAAEMEAGLRVEGIMDMARTAVQGNSTTARQLAELGFAGGAYGLGTGGNVLDPNPTAIMNAALVFAAAKGMGRVDQRVARRVAEMLTSNDPQVLTRGVQILARNQRMMDSLRSVDRRIAAAGAEQVPSGSVIQGPMRSAAEDEQQ